MMIDGGNDDDDGGDDCILIGSFIFRLTFVAIECGESCPMHWKVLEKTLQRLTTVT